MLMTMFIAIAPSTTFKTVRRIPLDRMNMLFTENIIHLMNHLFLPLPKPFLRMNAPGDPSVQSAPSLLYFSIKYISKLFKIIMFNIKQKVIE